MSNTLFSFSSVLERIMQVRNLTVGDLTEFLAYKSKTTISRALRQCTGHRGLQKLYQDLIQNQQLALTEEEKLLLYDSLQLCIRGEDLYLLNKELKSLIFSPISDYRDLILSFRSRSSMPLSSLKRFFTGCTCEILLLNSCYRSVSGFLSELIPSLRADSTVIHYVYFQEDAHRMIQDIHTMISMLRNNLYQMYALHPNNGDQSIQGDIIVVRCHQSNGSVSEYEIILHNEESGILNEGTYLYQKWKTFLDHYKAKQEPLRTVSSDGQLLEVLKTYEQLESKSNIYKLKMDLCLCYVHENTLRAALEDGCKAADVQPPEALVQSLSAIHKRRFENICARKKVKHLVMALSSMENFVRTGRLSDHFYLLRPFSPSERMEILTFCLNQQKNNPFIHFYFLKPEMEKKLLNGNMIELICFEKNCIQIIPSINDYSFSNGHTEIFIRDSRCVDLTTDFFQKELLKQDVTSNLETIKCFNYLIAIASEILAEEEKKASSSHPS